MTKSKVTLTLERLAAGDIPGITAYKGGSHVEACLLRLEANHHQPGASIGSGGDISGQPLELQWSTSVTPQMRRTWNDPQEALEEGAAGIAILTLLATTSFTVVDRACKGDGIDYWLGENDDDILFQAKARFEVSGLEKESASNTIANRVRRKKRQTELSASTSLPAYVGIVEFATPHTHLEKV